MTSRVLYLSPSPPARSGVADYAARFRDAIETASSWRFTVESFEEIQANSLIDLGRIRRIVEGWQRNRLLEATALVHAELGCHQHAIFHSLIALHRLAPRIPVCVTVHDPPLIVAPALFPLALGQDARLIRRALRLFDYTPIGRSLLLRPLRRAAQLFALTHAGANSLRRATGGRVPVEHLPHIGLQATRPRRKSRSVSGMPVKVLFAGFWGPRTGLPILLEAMEHLSRSGSSPVTLLLAGGSDAAPASQDFTRKMTATIEASAARPFVERLGFVPAENFDRLFQRADIFVLPYASVPALSSSDVLFRAAAAGLPIVASDLDTLREHIVAGRTGLIVPRGNAVALAQALALLASDPRLRDRLGRAIQSHVRQRHSAAAIASKVLPVYERLALLRGSS